MAIQMAYCWLTPRDADGNVSVQRDAFFVPGATMWTGSALTNPVTNADALITKFTNQTALNPYFPTKRVIKFTAIDDAMLEYGAGWPALIETGIDQSAGIAWVNSFCDRLIAQGEDVVKVLLDMERPGRKWSQVFSGMSAAQREAHMDTLYASSAATDRLPQVNLIDAYVAADYQTETVTTNPRIAWDQNAQQAMSHDLRSLFQDPMEAKFGHPIAMCEYDDQWSTPAIPTFNQYSAPRSVHGVNKHFMLSSPTLYVDGTVSGTARYSGLDKHPQWNALIDRMNICQSAIAAGSVLEPWVKTTNVDQHPQELVDAMFRLLAAMGVTTIYAFNNVTSSDADQGRADVQWLASMRATSSIDRASFRPQSIALDADQITIGSVAVTYSDLEPYLLP